MHVLHGWPMGKGEHLAPRRFRSVDEDCQVCLGSDKSSGGAHGVLGTEVDIILLLPVDPVCSRALPVEIKIKACNKAEKTLMYRNICY